MQSIATYSGVVVLTDGAVSCACCAPPPPVCFRGVNSKIGSGTNPNGPCVDFLTTITSKVPEDGFYHCIGGADDQATITWDGGNYFSPSRIPSVGPCYGGGQFDFSANFKAEDTVNCIAGSWGSSVGCTIECCLISAP